MPTEIRECRKCKQFFECEQNAKLPKCTNCGFKPYKEKLKPAYTKVKVKRKSGLSMDMKKRYANTKPRSEWKRITTFQKPKDSTKQN